MSQALLRVEGLEAGYGEVSVLRDVDLEVHAGELVTLVGANGAGKSTLLKCISGLLRPAAGQILLDGRRLAGLAPSRIVGLGVAHVPERRQVFSQLTVEDNLRLGAYSVRRRITALELKDRLDQACQPFPALMERLQEEAGRLSGGQQQMLAIARGLMLKPRLLLLDEPSLGLAPVLAERIMEVLGQLREKGIGILLVEQKARLSLALADRGYVLETGRITLSGRGAELLEMPEVVQRYLGVAAGTASDTSGRGVEEMARRIRMALRE